MRALHGHDTRNFRNMRRILLWLMASAVFWIAGGFLRDGDRAAAWIVALAPRVSRTARDVLRAGPRAARRPRTGTWTHRTWRSDARCSSSSRSASRSSSRARRRRRCRRRRGTCAAFIVAFIGSVAMWWIYFNIGAERGSRQFASSRGSRTRGAQRVHVFPHSDRRGHRGVRRGGRDHDHASRRTHDRGATRWSCSRVRRSTWRGICSSSARARTTIRCRTWSGSGSLAVHRAVRAAVVAAAARRGDDDRARHRRRVGDALLFQRQEIGTVPD